MHVGSNETLVSVVSAKHLAVAPFCMECYLSYLTVSPKFLTVEALKAGSFEDLKTRKSWDHEKQFEH